MRARTHEAADTWHSGSLQQGYNIHLFAVSWCGESLTQDQWVPDDRQLQSLSRYPRYWQKKKKKERERERTRKDAPLQVETSATPVCLPDTFGSPSHPRRLGLLFFNPKAADAGTAEWKITRFVLHGERRRRRRRGGGGGGSAHGERGEGLAPNLDSSCFAVCWWSCVCVQRGWKAEIAESVSVLGWSDILSYFFFFSCWHLGILQFGTAAPRGGEGGGGAGGVWAGSSIHKASHSAINLGERWTHPH